MKRSVKGLRRLLLLGGFAKGCKLGLFQGLGKKDEARDEVDTMEEDDSSKADLDEDEEAKEAEDYS
ncbi:hypothetical protein QOT17_012605 [Balamuthia mandrillaris]